MVPLRSVFQSDCVYESRARGLEDVDSDDVEDLEDDFDSDSEDKGLDQDDWSERAD